MILTHYGFFSGIGGFEIAAEAAGFKTVGMCEKDEYCRAILSQHFPGISIKEDINDFTKEDAGGRPIYLVTAGVPCQAASIAGKRRGKGDDRWLWPQTLKAIRALRPTWAVFENPLGLDSLDEFGQISDVDVSAIEDIPEEYSAALDEIIGQIEALGYEVQAVAIPSCAVAAPHQRMRIFIIAHAIGGSGDSGAERAGREAGTDAGGRCEGTAMVPDADSLGAQRHKPEDRTGSRPELDGENGSDADTPGAKARRRSRQAGAGEPDPGQRPGDVCQALPDADGKRQQQPEGHLEKGRRRAGDLCPPGAAADADGSGLEKQRRTKSAPPAQPAAECSGNVPDADGHVRERRADPEFMGRFVSPKDHGGADVPGGIERSAESGVGGVDAGLSAGLDRAFEWEPEPDIPRVAAGIPNREARLRALGNCLVWKQVFPILAAIAEVERTYARS